VKDVVENSFVGFIYILVGLGSICLALGFPIILELKTQGKYFIQSISK